MPGGGLSPHGKRWVACRKGFLLSVRVLSRLFRRLFIQELRRAYDNGRLEFHGQLESYREPEVFRNFLDKCRQSQWVVYAQPPFAGPGAVVDYLARYTHRIAISNHRLVEIKDGKVTFTYKDYKTGIPNKTISLEANEFIRRFLMHVLPNGFQRIRYYGFMANCHRVKKLALCRRLLHADQTDQPPSHQPQDRLTLFQSLTAVDLFQCPRCHKGRLLRSENLSPSPPPYSPRAHRARSP